MLSLALVTPARLYCFERTRRSTSGDYDVRKNDDEKGDKAGLRNAF
jgi:hypothetical protein